MLEPIFKPRVTPKVVFLNLAIIAALYLSVASWLHLVFQIINRVFPDRLEIYIDPYSTTIRLAVASLFVIYPVLLLLAWLLHRDFERVSEKRESGIRRWLVYLTLFVAGAVLVGDLIALLNTFLGGEISVRFILKVLAVFAAAGTVFGYYLLEIRRRITLPVLRVFLTAATLLVASSLVAGFWHLGSPVNQRYLRLDEGRLNHLREIQWQVVNFWQSKERLPQTLEDLADPLTGFAVPTDPETDAAYEYRPTGSLSFEICADFRLTSLADQTAAPKLAPVLPEDGRLYPAVDSWWHPAGRHCSPRTIDPDRFPPFSKRR